MGTAMMVQSEGGEAFVPLAYAVQSAGTRELKGEEDNRTSQTIRTSRTEQKCISEKIVTYRRWLSKRVLVEFFAVEDEAATEVFFAHDGVFCQFFGGALEEDFAFKKEVGAVGNRKCLGGVVVSNEDTDVFLF